VLCQRDFLEAFGDFGLKANSTDSDNSKRRRERPWFKTGALGLREGSISASC
jgi:hypothetical protein